MCRASRAWIRSAYRSRSSSVHVPSPASSSPAASPLTRHGSSWSWIQRMPLPSGAREGRSSAAGRTTIVASAGSRPALGLVDGARDAVEAGRDVDDRRAAEPLVALPARRLREREVDLHLGAAVAEARGALARPAPVRRPRRAAARRAASASRSRSPPAPPSRSRRPRAGRRPHGPSRTSTRSTSRPVSQTPPWSPISRTSASASRAPPPRGIGIPPSWTATAITCAMKPDAACVGPEARVQHPRARAGRAPAPRRTFARASRGSTASTSPANAAAPSRPSRRIAFAASASPAADQSSVPSTPNARSAFGKKRVEHARATRAAELRRVRLGGAQQERRLAVREQRARRQLGVQVLEPARGQVVAEQRVRGAADPERVPGAEDVVPEARLGELRRPDRAAEPVVPLEHADAPAGAREQRAAGERVSNTYSSGRRQA